MDKTSSLNKIGQTQDKQSLVGSLAQPPQTSMPTPTAAPNEPHLSHRNPPQSMSANSPQTQFIQGQTQPVSMVPQQVMHIPLNYTPRINFRIISYIFLAIGAVFVSTMDTYPTPAKHSAFAESLGSLMFCGFFTGAVLLDAAYYKSKANWQQANGMSKDDSTRSMVFELILGAIGVVIFLNEFMGFLPVYY